MKKTRLIHYLEKYFKIFVLSCLSFFNLSCGLDTYVVVNPPTKIFKQTNYNTTQFNEMYFEFDTEEDMGDTYPSDFKFLGTEVYYKIYSSTDLLESDTSYLKSMSGSTETSANIADKLINNYKYKPLKIKGNNSTPLIPAKKGVYQRVYIRLTDYQNIEDFSARITVDGNPIPGTNGGKSIPVRYENDLSFNFGRKGEKDLEPKSDDEDVKYTTNYKKWYVALFAVGVGRDVTYTFNYSNILYLGSMMIDANKYDN